MKSWASLPVQASIGLQDNVSRWFLVASNHFWMISKQKVLKHIHFASRVGINQKPLRNVMEQ